MLFDDNDFVVAVAVVVLVVVYFESVNFVVFAAGIDVATVHTLFVDCFPEVIEIVVVVVTLVIVFLLIKI